MTAEACAQAHQCMRPTADRAFWWKAVAGRSMLQRPHTFLSGKATSRVAAAWCRAARHARHPLLRPRVFWGLSRKNAARNRLLQVTHTSWSFVGGCSDSSGLHTLGSSPYRALI